MAETLLNQEEQKINTNNNSGKKGISSKNKRIIGIVLSLVMIALTAYVFKLQNDNAQLLNQSTEMALTAGVTQATNYRSYVKQYKDTKEQLEITTHKLEAVTAQLNDVTAQLAATKTTLNETQAMLTQAQSENGKLKEYLQSIDGIKVTATGNEQSLAELESRLTALKNKNNETNSEITRLRIQLRAFQADFSTLDEGRSLITLFQNKIKLVKTRMHYLQQEAYFAKIAAQKERDRIAALNGNNGFMIHNGEAVKTKSGDKNFSIDVKMVQ